MPNPVAPTHDNIDRVLAASDSVIDLLGQLRLSPRLSVVTVAITLGRLCRFARVELAQALLGASLAESVKPFPPVQVPTYEDEDSFNTRS